MNRPQKEYEFAFEKCLNDHYTKIEKGHCILSQTAINSDHANDCEGDIGSRHAISKRHLELIVDDDDCPDHFFATKEKRTFFEHEGRDSCLQPTSRKKFSSGKWACQKHDNIFKSLDAEQIDISEPENSFKAVCRVVFRHNLLMQLRWIPIRECVQTECGWKQFKDKVFTQPVGDKEADIELNERRRVANAVNTMADKLSRKLLENDWNSLQIRTCMLESEPTVAGWGCIFMQIPVDKLRDEDPHKEGQKNDIELGYVIVIPQKYGHAIITACAASDEIRNKEITQIHRCIPYDVKPNNTYMPTLKTRKSLSNWIWGFNELGIKASHYRSWNNDEKKRTNDWVRNEQTKKSVWLNQYEPPDLPLLL